jgi:hypothetical protein
MYTYPGATFPPVTSPVLSACAKAILKVLLYYDIFQYPLQEQEIYSFLSVKSEGALQEELSCLCQCGLIGQHEGYYFIGTHTALVNRRKKGNQEAEKYLKIARKHAGWLSALPFVQCICISGSLSKHYMDEKSDIDYFMIAEPNRLWILRAMLSVICKVLWVLRSQKYFCPNYIITPRTLEIRDQNMYTAIEIATLLPVYNAAGYMNFMQANPWIKQYFPNRTTGLPSAHVQPFRKKKPAAAWIQNLFATLDENLYHLYKKHYQRKFEGARGLNIAITELNFHKDIYKMHLSGHRNKILDRYEQNLQTYAQQYGIDLVD